ncbi:MAG: chromate transporter [Clostridia bacterium]|nr:chromate transporter [Clostridia bacterium]
MIYLNLFLTFLKIGAFTFGGGYAMLPLMKQEVLLNAWMSEEQLLNFIAVAESTPGPVAINMATYIGVQTGGLFGAFVATLGVVLPSFVVIMLVAKFYEKYKNSFIVKNCLIGLRPAVIGLMASAVITLGFGVLFPSGLSSIAFNFGTFASIVVFAIIVYLAFKKVSPIKLILLSALLGIAFGYGEKLIF